MKRKTKMYIYMMLQNMLDCLQGPLPVGERFKKINKISKQLKNSEVDKVLEILKTASDYDGIRLKLANDFKRPSCVLDILEYGDKKSIAQAVKLPWMYTDGSLLVDAEFLIETLFPRISFSTRLKIINNLGRHLKSPQTADYIFDAIKSKYGFPVASSMLQACSENAMDSLIGKRCYKLSSSQLLNIVKRSPQAGLRYLKSLYTNTANIKHDFRSSYKYLLDKCVDEMMALFLKYPDNCDLELGKKRSKRLLSTHSEDVLKLIRKKHHFIKYGQLKKSLSPQQYEQAFLKPISDLRNMLKSHWRSNEILLWLNPLSKIRQRALLQNAFMVAFNKNIAECPQYVTSDMVHLLSNEEKSKIVEWKLENDNSEFNCRLIHSHLLGRFTNQKWFWIAMKPTKDAIPELSKFIKSEKDASKRSDLFTYMVLCCIFNKDVQEFTKVLQLLIKKCRNDQPNVRETLIHLISESLRHFKFEHKLWACFEELLHFLQLYKEINRCNNTVLGEVLGKYAAYHQKHGKSFDVELNLIIKETLNDYFSFDTSFIKSPSDQRAMLEGWVKALSTVAEKVSTPSIEDDYIVRFVKKISEWNKYHQRKFGAVKISGYPWLEKRCWEIMTNDNYYNRIIVFKFLKQSSNLNPDFFDGVMTNTVCAPLLNYCLTRHPEKIADNVESILSNILKIEDDGEFNPYFIFIKKLKAAYYWELINKVRDECNKFVTHEDASSFVTEIGNAIRLLALLEPSSKFLEFAIKHYPAEAKIDSSMPIDELDYAIKKSVARSLKYSKDARASLLIVDRYLVGDYLKLALRSLYSICSAVPETQAMTYLQSRLKETPASVKKHMIRLFFMISPLDEKHKTLKDMSCFRKNPSIRFEILLQVYRIYRNTPNKDIWELLKSTVESLTDVDNASLEYVKKSTCLDNCLDELTSNFFQLILKTFKRVGVYKKYEGDIINRISNLISKLDGNFLDAFIQDVLDNAKKLNEDAYSNLVVNYLMDESISSQVRAHRLKQNQNIAQGIIDHRWNISVPNPKDSKQVIFPSRKFIANVCEGICNSLLECRGTSKSIGRKDILPELIRQFEDSKNVSKMFKNVVYMQLTLMVLENVPLEDSDWLKSVGLRVAPFLAFNAEKYGSEITCVISVVLKQVLEKALEKINDENILWVIDGLLYSKQDRCQLFTAISLLPRSVLNSELSELFERIANIIKGISDPTVQIYFELWESDTENEIQHVVFPPYRC